jgi:succinate dehydrogenase / fumarate reductase cytochrome b subunit
MLTSILHRATGVALYGGAFLFAAWLVAIGLGPYFFQPLWVLFNTIIGQIVLLSIAFSATFHLLSGLRHLVWDVGVGFNPRLSSAVSILIILAAIGITFGLWWWSALQTGPLL